MTKEIRTCCSRCGCICIANYSGLEVAYGDLLRDFDEAQIDLCSDCAERFKDFLRAGNARHRADSTPIRRRP